MKHAILVVDDDPTFCLMLQKFLEKKGLESKGVFSAEAAVEALKEKHFDAVLSDYRLPGENGLELLGTIRKDYGALPVVIMTSYADIRIAVQAMKEGAFDYVTKPVNPDEILLTINKAISGKPVIEIPSQVVPVQTGETMAHSKHEYVPGSGDNAALLNEHIALVAPTSISVLIIGESGSGKEYVAKRVHELSDRSNKPFVSIDCGALSKELAASELFGHIKGSFTGAIQDKTGQFEAADGGTLFLDEIGNLTYEIQVQLLRALQERKVRKIGSNKDIDVDVRILTATNEDLKQAVADGKFREDLYHRLNEFSIKVAPLRERNNDIEQFSQHFLELANNELNRNVLGFDTATTSIFKKYSWPGNLRELRNVIRRAVLLTKGEWIMPEVLPEEIIHEPNETNKQTENVGLKSIAEQTEREAIEKTLREVNFNKSKAAKLLNIDRKTLYNKMKQYGIN